VRRLEFSSTLCACGSGFSCAQVPARPVLVCYVARCSSARRIWFNLLICGVLLLQSCEIAAARESLSARSFSLLRSLPDLLSFALWFGFLLPVVRVFSASSGSCTLRDSSWLCFLVQGSCPPVGPSAVLFSVAGGGVLHSS
jgi:hypothetical protein